MRKPKKRPAPELPIAPMIDVVFLLLIYFMVSSTIQKQEADLSFSLPGTVKQDEPLNLPDEQIIVLSAEGQAVVNEFAYDAPEAPHYRELAGMLSRFREASEANRSAPRITIAPHQRTRHEAVVKVMDACSLAGIKSVTFAGVE